MSDDDEYKTTYRWDCGSTAPPFDVPFPNDDSNSSSARVVSAYGGRYPLCLRVNQGGGSKARAKIPSSPLCLSFNTEELHTTAKGIVPVWCYHWLELYPDEYSYYLRIVDDKLTLAGTSSGPEKHAYQSNSTTLQDIRANGLDDIINSSTSWRQWDKDDQQWMEKDMVYLNFTTCDPTECWDDGVGDVVLYMELNPLWDDDGTEEGDDFYLSNNDGGGLSKSGLAGIFVGVIILAVFSIYMFRPRKETHPRPNHRPPRDPAVRPRPPDAAPPTATATQLNHHYLNETGPLPPATAPHTTYHQGTPVATARPIGNNNETTIPTLQPSAPHPEQAMPMAAAQAVSERAAEAARVTEASLRAVPVVATSTATATATATP